MSGVTYESLQPAVIGHEPVLNMPALRRQLWAHGQDATWEKASRCPCSRESLAIGASAAIFHTTTAPGECATCKGTGLVYFGSQPARVLILGMTSRNQRSAADSLDTPGRMSITALTEAPLSQFDRVTSSVGLRRFTETFVKSAGVIDQLRFPIALSTLSVGTPGSPTVPLTQTNHVEYCIAADAAGQVVGAPTVYTEGVDFTVADSGANAGKLDWTIAGSGKPPAGVRVSIRYVCKQRFIITDLPFTARVSGQVVNGAYVPMELFHRGMAVLDGLNDG